MPALMRFALLVALLATLGCGKEIGDNCIISADCSPNGDRQCDTSSKEGYCTIKGCNFNSCPEEAACIRFFTGSFTNRMCAEPGPFSPECSLDELCSLTGYCVPRSAETRFCMRTCESKEDCRDGYECRDRDKMIEHGGEPVLAPDAEFDDALKFCAPAPA
jgi:hypothetical protein